MDTRADDRALAVQVGVTILLGFIILAIATYQVQVVPGQNARVEFGHSQTVQGQLQDVRGAVVSVPGGGTGRSVTVQLGTTYPERTIFLNPPPPSGQLRATAPATVTIANATASGEVADFWDGRPRSISTRTLVYDPDYNVYQNGPTTVVENTIVFDRTETADITESDQRLVDGRRITLIGLQGAYQEAGVESVAVDVRAVSSSTRTVAVSNDSAPVTITVPTTLSESAWRELLADERVSQGGHVTDIRYQPGDPYNRLTVVLEPGVTYELQMALVGLTNGVDRPGPAYVTAVEGDEANLQTGQSQRLVAEVRDRFNNPVSGVVLNASVVSGPGTVQPANATADADGRAAFTYTSSTAGTATVQVTFSNGPTASQTANFTVEVSGGGGGGGGAINPGDGVVLRDATIDANDASVVNIDLENLGDTVRNVSELQYTFYSVDGQGGSTANSPESVDVEGTPLELQGSFGNVTPPVTIASGATERLRAQFYQNSGASGSTFDVQQGDFFVLSVVFENGDVVRYFVAPTSGSPTADAGGPYTVDEGGTQTLDGSGSSDADGSISTYEWTITNDPTGSASISDADTTTPEATFDAPADVSSDTNVTVELTVTDNDGNTDTVTTTVTVRDTGGGTTTMAERTDYNNDGTADGPGGDTSGVSFSLTNTGTNDVTITGIAVDSPGSADELLEKSNGNGQWNRELFVDATTDGYFESGDGGNDEYILGTGQVSLDSTATIGGSTTATLYLYEFTEAGSGGSGGPVDMTGETVTVTIYYSDGSTDTISFTG